MELRFSDDKNNTFVVNSDNYEMYKIIDGKRELVSIEERNFVFGEINKMQDISLNRPKTYEDFLNLLKEMIKKGSILNYDTLNNFVKSCNLNEEEKQKLLAFGLGELQIQNVIDLKNRIMENLEQNKKPNLNAIINFSVIDNSIGPRYCEISLKYQDEVNTYDHIKEHLVYNENLEKELIEPIVLEVARRSQIKMHYAERINDPVNKRGNFRLGTEEKTFLGVNNIDYEYAMELNDRCEDIVKEMPIEDKEERSEAISSDQGKEYGYQNDYQDNIITQDGVVYTVDGEYLGYINEMGEIVRTDQSLEQDKGKGRILDRKGLSNSIIIFAITSLISGLIILLEIYLLK